MISRCGGAPLTSPVVLSCEDGDFRVWDEESGELHRELEGFDAWCAVTALASFLSPDGQQARLVASGGRGEMRIYDPEAGSVLHRLDGHTDYIFNRALVCLASSSAAPHHPLLVSAAHNGTVKVWDGETGECLADLKGHEGPMRSVAVWKEQTGEGEHDRIATAGEDGKVKVWDGEALTLLHDLDCGPCQRVLPFESAEGSTRLLVANERLQVWDPEEGRLLHNPALELTEGDCHLFESAQGRHLLATVGRSVVRHPGEELRSFVDVWDLGQAPARDHVRPAHHLG
jgi:WD40 repeat protein